MNKIVELVINLEEFEFDDLGVEILSLVDKPAIEVNWMAFSEHQFVTPSPIETKDEFISRCIPVVIGEGKDEDQAAAICYSYWDEGFSEDDGTDLQQFASYSDYPDSVKNNAQRGIDLNEAQGNKCATQVGKVRAQQLAKGEAISEDTIKRMKSYLSRAAVYYEAGDTESCGYISYLLWGGKSALTWAESKLNQIENEKFEKSVLDIAKETGEVIDPTEIIYVDGTKDSFASVGDFLEGAKALDALGDLPLSIPAEIRYRYAGPAGQRTFCATLKALNRVYSREDIARMNIFNPGFGPGGSGSYDVFSYKGGPNCQHYWEELVQFNNGTKNVLISMGPATGLAGESNNRGDQSPTGSVANNAYLMSNWSFSADDQMIVTGPAMIPRQLIPRIDELGNLFWVYFSKETIEKIARKFLADNNTHNTDINHNGQVVKENTLLESWIVSDPEKDKASVLGFNVPKGTWMASYKINNKDTWNRIKAGELNGFSVEGSFLEIAQN